MNLLKLTYYVATYLDKKSWKEHTIIINADNIDYVHPSDDCKNCSVIVARGDEFTIKVPYNEVINYLEAEHMKQHSKLGDLL